MLAPSMEPPPASTEQRHDFILHYYDMAVHDLERHLKIGWQTLGAVAGAIVLLSLAEKRELPVWLAVAGALTISAWGCLNVFDSNYWALRAIGFLANVESVYFGVADRRRFNPYVGAHPPFHLLDSLRYQAWVASVFATISGFYYCFAILRTAKWSMAGTWKLKQSMPLEGRVFWYVPMVLGVVLVTAVLRAYSKRLLDYTQFVTNSPGSGLFFVPEGESEGVAASYLPGPKVQEGVRCDLEKRAVRWRRLGPWVWIGAAIVLLAETVLVFGG